MRPANELAHDQVNSSQDDVRQGDQWVLVRQASLGRPFRWSLQELGEEDAPSRLVGRAARHCVVRTHLKALDCAFPLGDQLADQVWLVFDVPNLEPVHKTQEQALPAEIDTWSIRECRDWRGGNVNYLLPPFS